ncbi:hypothetical protein AB0L57_00945 [Nocardia sp. NPDC052254]|uniref:hypothetical protein n=1 Tax=Nocardia sp. NPDC052254 TaxID=3155681 RepID=UPI00341CB0EC
MTDPRHTDIVENWFEAAVAAEARRDWDAAISAVEAVEECYSVAPERHDAHLWHMDLLVKARYLDELAARSETDVHARRRLDRFLYEDGRDRDLRQRALHGDKQALYFLVRLLRQRGDEAAARRAVAEIDGTDGYALELAMRP